MELSAVFFASIMSRRSIERGAKATPVSLGYDKIRFLKPVFIGDTLTARYTIGEIDAEAGRSRSEVEVVKSDGEKCLAGIHVMKWVARIPSRRSRWLRLPYGDQGLFVWRQVFESLAGFPEIPILEDVAFARKLRRMGRFEGKSGTWKKAIVRLKKAQAIAVFENV